MPDRDLITEGRRLLAEAGTTPWVVGAACESGGHYIGTAPDDPGDAELLGETVHAQLIVHMHNTYGELLDEVQGFRDGGRINVYVAEELTTLRRRVAALERQAVTLHDQIEHRLDNHRATSTRNLATGEYKNPARQGYDRALTEVLAMLTPEAADHA